MQCSGRQGVFRRDCSPHNNPSLLHAVRPALQRAEQGAQTPASNLTASPTTTANDGGPKRDGGGRGGGLLVEGERGAATVGIAQTKRRRGIGDRGRAREREDDDGECGGDAEERGQGESEFLDDQILGHMCKI